MNIPNECWIHFYRNGTRGIVVLQSQEDCTHYMRVKPCPDCGGDGKDAYEFHCNQCHTVGWVIA